jgi:cysteine desulfurase/selenocysteine lyase
VTGEEAVCLLPGGKLDWDQIRGEFAIVSRQVPVLGSGSRALVYLDHAASTHAPTSVLNAYVEFLEREYANIHRGTHILSRRATERFDEAYYVVADYLGAELKTGAVCFVANTTQAIDLASHCMSEIPGKVITTELEHHSNELTHRRRGPVLRARVTDSGELDLDHLDSLLRKNDVKLVAVTAGSNISGVIPPIHTIARMAHDAGALILVDAAQALARLPIDVKRFDDPDHIDFLAAAGHKAYAPFGSGFLYGPRHVMTQAPPYVPGGGTASSVTQRSVHYLEAPDRHHGGTPNIAGVVGMARALLFLQAVGLDAIREHEQALTAKTIQAFEELGGVTVYGPSNPASRLGVISFNVDGVDDLMTAAILSEEGGLAVRNGRFCAHLYMQRLLESKHGKSDRDKPGGAVRASYGLYNCESDVGRLCEYVKRVRDRKWIGKYRIMGDRVNAEFAGRCADKWMESTGDPQAIDIDIVSHEYYFQAFHTEGNTRAYMFADEERKLAAIVDPIREHVDKYLDTILEHGFKLVYTIETHTHADHLSGSVRLKDITGCRMLMHEAARAPCVDQSLNDGDTFNVGDVSCEVIASPGHTRDGVSILLPGRLLTGDSLLIGGCGRTDLPTGDAVHLYETLQRLKKLPEDTLVFPGHDYNGQRGSTIGRELKQNPRLSLSLEDFVATMTKLVIPPPQKLRELLKANEDCL